MIIMILFYIYYGKITQNTFQCEKKQKKILCTYHNSKKFLILLRRRNLFLSILIHLILFCIIIIR